MSKVTQWQLDYIIDVAYNTVDNYLDIDEFLKDICESEFGKLSINDLSSAEASKVIEYLKKQIVYK